MLCRPWTIKRIFAIFQRYRMVNYLIIIIMLKESFYNNYTTTKQPFLKMCFLMWCGDVVWWCDVWCVAFLYDDDLIIIIFIIIIKMMMMKSKRKAFTWFMNRFSLDFLIKDVFFVFLLVSIARMGYGDNWS